MKLCRSIVGAALLAGAAAMPAPARAKEASPALSMARQLNEAFVEVADSVVPSVVVISVAVDEPQSAANAMPFFRNLPESQRRQLERFFGRLPGGDDEEGEGGDEGEESEREPRQPRERSRNDDGEPRFNGQGSGMVIREEGFILTNNHVVENAKKLKVRFRDGREVEAEIRGTDPESDLAVLKLKEKVPGLVPVKFTDSDKVRVGEFAIAIGAPFELDYSVTYGHVSAKGRHALMPRRYSDEDFIQTDANINPGNSGGPLVNINGDVMGVNAMIRGLNSGIGFAIPSNLAREISDRLVEDGRFVRSWLGIGIADVRSNPRINDIDPEAKTGVLVQGIQQGGPAAKSELRASDIITDVDGKTVNNSQQLRAQISRKKAGKEITLNIRRDGKPMKIKVTPGEMNRESEVAAAPGRTEKPAEDAGMELGMVVKAITPELARQFDVEATEGVIVTEVRPNSLAAKYGLKPGDIVTDINHQTVTSPKEFRDTVRNAKGRVLLSFIRDGTKQFEVLKDRAR
jgi:serine protease Do